MWFLRLVNPLSFLERYSPPARRPVTVSHCCRSHRFPAVSSPVAPCDQVWTVSECSCAIVSEILLNTCRSSRAAMLAQSVSSTASRATRLSRHTRVVEKPFWVRAANVRRSTVHAGRALVCEVTLEFSISAQGLQVRASSDQATATQNSTTNVPYNSLCYPREASKLGYMKPSNALWPRRRSW